MICLYYIPSCKILSFKQSMARSGGYIMGYMTSPTYRRLVMIMTTSITAHSGTGGSL
jgi:hypothetical protein